MQAHRKTYRILIVDDDAGALSSLHLTLQRAKEFDSDIVLANGWREAFGALAGTEFDLVLCDYMMPEVNGIEVLAKVMEKSPRTRRVLITGYSGIAVAKDAINKAKVHGYLEKPWDFDKLRDVIYEELKKRDAERR